MSTAQLTLTRGQVATIDAADFRWLSQWKWSAGLCNGKFYAVRGEVVDGKNTAILLHRFILGVTDWRRVDHRDRDQLNDRRENLRISTSQENNMNRAGNGTGRKTSRFKGVYWQRDIGRWRAKFQSTYLGTFTDEETAAVAYDRAAFAAFPEYAFLNFPKEVHLVGCL